MSRRRCCCGGSEAGGIPCPGCPEPISPCVCPIYEIERFFVSVTADSAGNGSLFYQSAFRIKDCMRGDCGRTAYRRKSVSPSNQVGEDCDPSTFDYCVCQAMVDIEGPSVGGDLYWRGSPCGSNCPDGELDYEGAVAAVEIVPQTNFVAATCSWGTMPVPDVVDCRSLIVVDFQYNDSYSLYPSVKCIDGECIETGKFTLSVNQGWTCYYSKRVQAGQFMATGAYRLVRCDYPAAITTIGPGTGNTLTACNILGGTVCSADGLSSVKVPTIWQPPGQIVVNRLC